MDDHGNEQPITPETPEADGPDVVGADRAPVSEEGLAEIIAIGRELEAQATFLDNFRNLAKRPFMLDFNGRECRLRVGSLHVVRDFREEWPGKADGVGVVEKVLAEAFTYLAERPNA